MRLVNVVLYLGQSRLEATVQDADDHRRRINFTWLEKVQSDTPPPHWAEAVGGEVEFQRSQDKDQERGRRIPF